MTEVIDRRPPQLQGLKVGRPIGSVSIASRRASKKLEELGFDPIEKLVELYDRLDSDIYNLTYDENGLPRTKYSVIAYSNLMAAKQRCITELMRYGYARAMEGVEVHTQALAPITISLATTPESFDKSLQGADEDDRPMKGDDE